MIYYSVALVVGILAKDCIKETDDDDALFFGRTLLEGGDPSSVEQLGFNYVWAGQGTESQDVIGLLISETGYLNGCERDNWTTEVDAPINIERAMIAAEKQFMQHGISIKPKLYMVGSAG